MSMLTIGDMLKSARENKSLSVEQVQKQTRIHSSVLRALEEGRCDEILTPAYVRSFLKKYSNHLNLDTTAILKEYSTLHPEPSGRYEENSGQSDYAKYMTYVYYLVVGLVILSAIFAAIFVGKMVIGAIFKKKDGARQVSVSQRQRTDMREAKRLDPSSRTQAVSRQSVEATKSAAFSMVLKVKKNVYVKLWKDGKLLFGRVLTKGLAETFKANEKIDIYVAKGESIDISIDGKSLGSPGRGIIKNLEVTKRGFRVK